MGLDRPPPGFSQIITLEYLDYREKKRIPRGFESKGKILSLNLKLFSEIHFSSRVDFYRSF